MELAMSWQAVEGCTKLLAAVSKLVDAGNWVVDRPEEDGGSYIYNKSLKKTTYLRRGNGVWTFDMWILNPLELTERL